MLRLRTQSNKPSSRIAMRQDNRSFFPVAFHDADCFRFVQIIEQQGE